MQGVPRLYNFEMILRSNNMRNDQEFGTGQAFQKGLKRRGKTGRRM